MNGKIFSVFFFLPLPLRAMTATRVNKPSLCLPHLTILRRLTVNAVTQSFIAEIIFFLISNFRHAVNIVFFLFCDFPASEFYITTFQNTLRVQSLYDP
jgi:hypothetical protein